MAQQCSEQVLSGEADGRSVEAQGNALLGNRVPDGLICECRFPLDDEMTAQNVQQTPTMFTPFAAPALLAADSKRPAASIIDSLINGLCPWTATLTASASNTPRFACENVRLGTPRRMSERFEAMSIPTKSAREHLTHPRRRLSGSASTPICVLCIVSRIAGSIPAGRRSSLRRVASRSAGSVRTSHSFSPTAEE